MFTGSFCSLINKLKLKIVLVSDDTIVYTAVLSTLEGHLTGWRSSPQLLHPSPTHDDRTPAVEGMLVSGL